MKKENIKYVDSNIELSNFITSLRSMTDLLNNEVARMFMFASIISSDAIVDLASAMQAQEKLDFVVNNVKYFNISDEIKNEIMEFSARAQEIITKDIKKYSRKKRTTKKTTSTKKK